MRGYGKELILDLHECDVSLFNRNDLKKYFKAVCRLIDMEQAKLVWWDYYNEPENYKIAPPHLKGTTAVQFIMTSNITIHTLELLKRVYVNIFSCKDFEAHKARRFTEKWFKGKIVRSHTIERV